MDDRAHRSDGLPQTGISRLAVPRLVFPRPAGATAAGLARLERALPFLFLAYALPMILFLAVAVPVYLNPDETNHAMRAEMVVHGDPLARRTGPLEAGGEVDAGLLQLLAVHWPLLIEPDRRMTQDMAAQAKAVGWSGQRVFASIPNTAVYPPTLYLPVAAGIGIGKTLHLPVETSLILARLLNGAVAAGLTALAIAVAARGRFVIFTAMLFPMALAQFASCSQDALLLAGGALLAALLSRPLAGNRPATAREYGGAALLVALLSMSRPTNLALILPLLLPPLAPWGKAGERRAIATGGAAALAVTVAVAATLAWVVWVALFVQVPQPHSGIVPSMGDQLRHLAGDPLSLGTVLWNTALRFGHDYYVMLIGYLGWGGVAILLPPWFYPAAAGTLLLACAAEALPAPDAPEDGRPAAASLLVAWASVAAAVLGILVIQYLSFSRVGGPVVEGVQGRYFLPLAAMAGLLVPAVAAPAALRLVPAAPVLAFPLATLLLLPPAVIGRIYLSAG